MRHNRFKLILFLLLLIGLGFAYRQGALQPLTRQLATWRTEIPQTLAAIFEPQQVTTSTQATATTTKGTTPTEAIVQGVTLDKTYYYHFDKKLPDAGVKAFTNAVAIYNRTGIVHLIDGSATKHDNQITFSVYHKKMPANQSTVELGHGGPQITQETSLLGSAAWNHAKASLNGDYRNAYTTSVAVHELGHALGLDHSQSPTSVMYPYSQGRTKLSSADLAGLRAIYTSK
ncbi:matrixin family metalloprotease [Levilactobacillus suantsaii]|uniref:Zn-dependent protease n=1 Tax=Levilactobacillus suantsaii TaxID=2292255 RepID=A0A4Q0VFK7_9LACO|nr:matrixin family metalloprotease [Levilactobacillus suantsaii]QMU08834.1 matrixin family metalloprotease [Levilactobacillus suantsaii]RXI76719.1 Zn-dependent protease [Levilactobacillus suantsaii]